METKFTKGPWIYRPAKGVFLPRINGVCVYGALDNDADGYLMGAAPALYEALESVMVHFRRIAGDCIDQEQCNAEMRACEQAEAAFAAARGDKV